MSLPFPLFLKRKNPLVSAKKNASGGNRGCHTDSSEQGQLSRAVKGTTAPARGSLAERGGGRPGFLLRGRALKALKPRRGQARGRSRPRFALRSCGNARRALLAGNRGCTDAVTGPRFAGRCR